MALLAVVLLAAALAAWLWLGVHYLDMLRATAWLRPAFVEGGAPFVSIIVPARNEAHQIGRCLSSLLAQDYPSYEVIAVDDRSEDGTLQVMRGLSDPRLTVVEGAALPEGWIGKSWANHQGVERARGQWLLFTDADTWHAPGALAATVGHAEGLGVDLLSLFPFLICETFWEKLLQPAILFLIAASLPRQALEEPSRPEALANGQYLLIRQDMYERVGGHAAIRGSIVDDMSLAIAVKAAGGRIVLPVGVELVKVRMYTGLREIWSGWSKNLYAGARGDWRLAFLGMLAMLVFNVVPFVALPYFAWQVAVAPTGAAHVALGLSVAVVTAALLVRADGLRRLYDLSPLWALWHPIAFLVVTAIFANSTWRALSGKGPEWKGRSYPGGGAE